MGKKLQNWAGRDEDGLTLEERAEEAEIRFKAIAKRI